MKQRMVDAAIFPPIIQISINQEVGDTKYEAMYAISIASRRGSHEQIRYNLLFEILDKCAVVSLYIYVCLSNVLLCVYS